VLGLQTVGNTVQATQLDDSVNHWLIIGSFPVTSPVPQFHSQTVQNLQGAGSFCQTVNVKQGGSVVPITHFIDQATLASPAMVLQ
jgi:hypothetical protein